MSEHMDRQQSRHAPAGSTIPQQAMAHLAFLSKKRVYSTRIHLPVLRLYVDHDGPRADVPDGVRRRDERKRRDKHFIIRPDTRYQQRDMESGCAAGCGHGMRRAEVRSYLPLEPIDERTDGRHPPGIETLFDICPFIAREGRNRKGNLTGGRGGARFARERRRSIGRHADVP
jgi:hypothetical protein